MLKNNKTIKKLYCDNKRNTSKPCNTVCNENEINISPKDDFLSQPITINEKNVFTVSYDRKVPVWKEINNYFEENKIIINNYSLIHSKDQFFCYLKNTVYDHLNNSTRLLKNLSINERDVIPREIIYIYLVTTKCPPHKSAIIKQAGANKNSDELFRLEKISELFNIKIPVAYSNGHKLSENLVSLLDSKKKDILQGNFIPDTKNIISVNPEFKGFNSLTEVVSRWLVKETPYTSLRDYKKSFAPTYRLKEFLESKKYEILNGEYFPTMMNLRKFDLNFNNEITGPYTIINNWLIKASNNKFENMSMLIKHFDPNPEKIGCFEKQLKHEDYTLKFESIEYRLKKAFFQTIKIINEEKLIQLKFREIRGWRGFFNYLNNLNDYYLADLLTGERITSKDYSNAKINFHHLDGNKKNDNDDNLGFLLEKNHNIITASQRYYIELSSFFFNILKSNLKYIENQKVPLSWNNGWRNIAMKSGLQLPEKCYRDSKTDNSYNLDSFLD